jgi:hypothetical protein
MAAKTPQQCISRDPAHLLTAEQQEQGQRQTNDANVGAEA